MIDTHKRPIQLRPRRPGRKGRDESRAWSKAFKGLMQIVRMTSSRAASRSQGARRSRQQRCAVRVTYSPNRLPGQWYAHGRYIEREGGTTSEIAKTLGEWQKAGDERMFKIIVSPEFGERMDLERHAGELMTRMSEELGVPLEWVAAVHHNTNHPHVHIALRGSGGLLLPKDYVRHGLRRHAEELCTGQLGYRTELDIRESDRREVAAQHPTSLDRRIARLQAGERLSPILASRLRTLQRMGLANSSDKGTWEVRPDFLAILRAMKKATDRQKMIAAHAAAISNPHLPVQYTPVNQIRELEGRVVGHTIDDASGMAHMILEGTDQKIHLVPHDPAIESARRAGQLAPNTVVRLQRRATGPLRISLKQTPSPTPQRWR